MTRPCPEPWRELRLRAVAVAVEAFPTREEYRNKTSRTIPVFVAEPA